MVLLSFAVTFYIAPDADQRWEWITPGSLLGTVGFLAGSLGFRHYIEKFTHYDKTYGSLGGVMVLMFWFWISSVVLLVAAQMNQVIEDASPLGKRYGQRADPSIAPDLAHAEPVPLAPGPGAEPPAPALSPGHSHVTDRERMAVRRGAGWKRDGKKPGRRPNKRPGPFVREGRGAGRDQLPPGLPSLHGREATCPTRQATPEGSPPAEEPSPAAAGARGCAPRGDGLDRRPRPRTYGMADRNPPPKTLPTLSSPEAMDPMKTTPRCPLLVAAALGGLFLLSPIGRAHAQATKPDAPPKPATHTEKEKKSTHSAKSSHAVKEADLPDVNLLDAARAGAVLLDAEGMGDGRMAVIVTNSTNRPLKVVLPPLPGRSPGRATGQMLGLGGMGGMGGGMGGMGGGMGGMGGGMGGGMMGGRGGMGGGMMGGRGGMMGGTMPASMGMMTLGRLIMFLIGDMSSWNFRSIMMGGMMGGMGMGGMGGGMLGGMGGMGGMMGGGMRSVPPTGQPFAVVHPGKTLRLPTRLVSLGGPSAEGTVAMPAQGEKLTLGDIGQLAADPRVAEAVRRLAAEKAPTVASQLVMWNVAAGLDWDVVARMSAAWADSAQTWRRPAGSWRAWTPPRPRTQADLREGPGGRRTGRGGGEDFAKDGSLLGLQGRDDLSPTPPTGRRWRRRSSCRGRRRTPRPPSGRPTAAANGSTSASSPSPCRRRTASSTSRPWPTPWSTGCWGRCSAPGWSWRRRAHGKEKGATDALQILNRSPLILNGVALAGGEPAGPEGDGPGRALRPERRPGQGPRHRRVGRRRSGGGSASKKGVHILAADLPAGSEDLRADGVTEANNRTRPE